MPEIKTVMISSTARDLPDHREEMKEACLRQGMFPVMMEHLPASDADAIAASLKMVDDADIYLGVFAHRYGYVPKGYTISITEMEYNRAVERKIPRLIFLMHADHPLKAADVETGEGAIKLKALKERLGTERVVNFFKSPEDLRAHVINSLSQYRVSDLTAFHYVGDIPAPPEAYIAHPYTLLQTGRLVGRQAELNLLTDWVTKRQTQVYWARILNIVAIGGMGKSALTWKWFNDIAPHEMTPLAGQMWWSFYESDATFENLIIRALAYISRRSQEEVQQIPAPEREAQLLAALDREPFLLVLDGLERILIAYARMDAARLADDDLDERTANFIADVAGLPQSATQSFIGQHRLRKTADPRAGAFLRKLANVRASKILVSTRLYPADLQVITGDPVAGSFAAFLTGLSDDDALDLWRDFKVSGSRDELLRLFDTFDNHPLLIQALASEIAQYRRAPGDFERWRRDHSDFDPFSLPLVNVKSHVLGFALHGLDEAARQVLYTVAAFRMPAGYDTLATLLVGKGKPCPNERNLDAALTELEDRGLLGWDKRANRYDLHPIVRGVTWSGLNDDARRGIYGMLQAHFESLPAVDEDNINSLGDLASAIELYNTLIGLKRYDDAEQLFYERLSNLMLYRLSASRQCAELLEMLFLDGLDKLPRLSRPDTQASTLNALALSYELSGRPRQASVLYRLRIAVDEKNNFRKNVSNGLDNLANAQRLSGVVRESEAAARWALLIHREQGDLFEGAYSLLLLGLALAVRGDAISAEMAFQQALEIYSLAADLQTQGFYNAYLAQGKLLLNKPIAARSLADRAWDSAHVAGYERDFIRAAWLQGMAALRLGDLPTADGHLHYALARARAVNHLERETQALVALAELRRRQRDPKAARELLDDVWEPAERGPYPLDHADAYNVLAQIERDAGEHAASVDAATKAYRLAWCDGPPFAYHWGLEAARAHLIALGAPEPEMPPFDESKYEPMPEVEIDPEDEFHVGE